MTETELEAGTLTLVLNVTDVGAYTFAEYNGGWSIRNADGTYLKPVGKVLALTDQPFAWELQDGVFVSHPTVAVTMLGKLFTLGRTRPIYLNVVAGGVAVSANAGAAATFLKPVAE